MSLIAWYPLINDFDNKGVEGYVPTIASGNSWASSGKIGTKSLTITKLQTILQTTSKMTGAKEMSYCYWVKVNTAWSTQWLDGIRWYSTDGSSTYESRQEFYNNCTTIGTWYKYGSISGKSFTPGIWTHLAGTYNYITGEANFYINGVCVGTTTNVDCTHYCRGDFYIGDNGVDICENDVRIYDHCLSAAEVHEISQGLVLHYKLDSGSLPLNKNIVGTARYGESASSGWGAHRGASTKVDLDASAQIPWHKGTKLVVTYDTSLGSGGGCGFYLGEFTTASNTTYCYSLYIQAPDDLASLHANWLYRYEYNSSSTQQIEAGVAAVARSISLGNHWYRIWGTFTTKTETTKTRFYFYTYPGKNITYYFGCPQVELGSTMTPWNDGNIFTIITDSSGYGHNGTVTGNPSIVSNTPRYSSGIHLERTRINSSTGFPSGDNPNFTIAFWTKIFSNITYVSYGDLCGMYDTGQGSNTFRLELCGSPSGDNLMWFRGPSGQNGGGFNMNSNSSSGWFSKDTWHHVALVGDGINKKYYCYLDGQLCQTYNGSANSWTPTGQVYLGDTVEATADFSDFRIYCTALSADDILSLYHTAAKVDNLHNMHTFEYIENSPEIKLTKQGQFKEGEIQEDTVTKFYKTDKIIKARQFIEK